MVEMLIVVCFFFFSSRRRHTRCSRDWSSDVCSSDLWHPDASEDYGDYMMLSLYVTLGVFLLIAARNASAHRSLIAFTAWSSFAHALVMGTMAFQFANQRVGFLWGSAVLVVIGVALIVLAPAKASAAFAPRPCGLVHDNASIS